MLVRIVKEPIQIVRDGALVYPPVGQRVELTAEEVADLNKVNPSALGLPVVDAEPITALTRKPSAKK